MKVTLLHATPMTAIYRAVAICRNSKEPAKALQKGLKAGHDSLLEHWIGQFEIIGISRACSHQLVRHRMASYSQQSQRHVEITKDSQDWYVVPPNSKPFFHTSMEALKQAYLAEVADGVPLEDARFLLQNAVKTNIIMTINARSLHNFFNHRLCSRAQWEIREMAAEMFYLCHKESPGLFKGPFPDCDRCKEPCK